MCYIDTCRMRAGMDSTALKGSSTPSVTCGEGTMGKERLILSGYSSSSLSRMRLPNPEVVSGCD